MRKSYFDAKDQLASDKDSSKQVNLTIKTLTGQIVDLRTKTSLSVAMKTKYRKAFKMEREKYQQAYIDYKKSIAKQNAALVRMKAEMDQHFLKIKKLA